MERVRYKIFREPINFSNPFKIVDTYTGLTVFRGNEDLCIKYLNEFLTPTTNN